MDGWLGGLFGWLGGRRGVCVEGRLAFTLDLHRTGWELRGFIENARDRGGLDRRSVDT